MKGFNCIKSNLSGIYYAIFPILKLRFDKNNSRTKTLTQPSIDRDLDGGVG